MLIDSFLDYIRKERTYSECTVRACEVDLRKFRDYFTSIDKNYLWQDVDASMVRKWIIYLLRKGYAESSINRKLSSLRSFFRFLLQQEEIVANPMLKVRGPKRKKILPDYVSEAEMDKLLDEVEFDDSFEGARDKLILEMFYLAGLRLSELVGLDDGDVDTICGQIKVTGKRNKQRLIPFGGELKSLIQNYTERKKELMNTQVYSDAFFVDMDGVRIGHRKVQRLVGRYLADAAKVKKKSPHVLRHTFATSMLNNSADLSVVKELLGHESLAATEVYTHVSFEELKKVYKQAHPRA